MALLQRGCQDGLDGVHPVFCLVKDDRLGAGEYGVGDFHIASAEFLAHFFANLGFEIVEGGEAVHKYGLGSGGLHQFFRDRVGGQGGNPLRPDLRGLSHGHPYVGAENLGPLDGGLRILVKLQDRTGLFRNGLALGHQLGVRQEFFRSAGHEVHAHFGAADHEGVAHIVPGIPQIHQLDPGKGAEVLPDGQKVRQDLGGVELIGQTVPHGDPGVFRQLLHDLLTVAPVFDAVIDPSQDLGRVGGLVGQMEPYIEMSLSDSTLTQVQKQLKELQDLVDKASKDAESGVGGISSRLSSVNGSIQNAAQEAANVKVNIGASGSVSGDGSGEASGSVTVTTPDVNVDVGSTTETTPTGGTATDVDVSISGGTGSADGSGEASGSVDVTGNAQIVAAPDLGGLTASISGVGSQLSQLNGAIAGTTGQLAEDVRAINEKFGAISDTIYNAIAEADDPANNPVKDTSANNIAAVTLGKVKGGQNSGAVSGDLNVGGIAGTIAVEYSVDPEDDLSASVSGKYKREYELKAIVEDCANTGVV